MLKKTLFLLLIVFCISCRNKIHLGRVFNYHYVTANDFFDEVKLSDSIIFESKVTNDSITVRKNNQIMFSGQFTIDSVGIYIKKHKNKYLLYPFIGSSVIERNKLLLGNVYSTVRLIGTKLYNINGNDYRIYHYVEDGFDNTLDSYYLKGEGFICFYKYSDNYFEYLKSPKATIVAKELLNDTSFFAYHKLKQADKKLGRKF